MSDRNLPVLIDSTSVVSLRSSSSALARRGLDSLVDLANTDQANKLFMQAMEICKGVDFERVANRVKYSIKNWDLALTPSQREAEDLLRKAAEMIHAEAAFCLAAFCIDKAAGLGRELELDERSDELCQARLPLYLEALDWFRQSAREGHVPAQKILGDYLWWGCFRPSSYFNWYRLGDAKPIINQAEAEVWLTKAANSGDANAQHELGLILSIEKRFSEAKYWFQKAAEQGHSLSQWELASLCLKEHDGLPAECEQGIHWLYAALDNPKRIQRVEDRVTVALGAAYLTGLAGLKQDYKKALELLERVATRTTLPHVRIVACWLLGFMYEAGLGTESDTAVATHFYEKGGDLEDIASYFENMFGVLDFDVDWLLKRIVKLSTIPMSEQQKAPRPKIPLTAKQAEAVQFIIQQRKERLKTNPPKPPEIPKFDFTKLLPPKSPDSTTK